MGDTEDMMNGEESDAHEEQTRSIATIWDIHSAAARAVTDPPH
jgi:hypothetical protein